MDLGWVSLIALLTMSLDPPSRLLPVLRCGLAGARC